jgi:hypothetical protein
VKNFFTTPHPPAALAASLNQTPTLSERDTTMTKTFSFALAFVLFAPVAIGIAMQAARIFA